MKSKFEQLRALLTQEEWDNFLANVQLPESQYDDYSSAVIIAAAFPWCDSPQGHAYWDKIHERIANNQPALTTPPPKTYTIKDIKIAFLDGYFEGAGDDAWYAAHDPESGDCEAVKEDSLAHRLWLEYLAELENTP